jgi:hypothetical protein
LQTDDHHCSNVSDIVFDPMFGTASSLASAKPLAARRCCELSQTYYDRAVKRFAAVKVK